MPDTLLSSWVDRDSFPIPAYPDDVTTTTVTDRTLVTGNPLALTNPALTSLEAGRPMWCYTAYIDIPQCAVSAAEPFPASMRAGFRTQH
jgi:hypothetical protein